MDRPPGWAEDARDGDEAVAEDAPPPARSVERVVRVPPVSRFCLLGMNAAFDDAYPAEALEGVLGRRAFEAAVESANDAAFSFWPCFLCKTCAVGCCPLTAGLSCLCPSPCISDAVAHVRRRLALVNRSYRQQGVRARWRLVRRPWGSRLEVLVLSEALLP